MIIVLKDHPSVVDAKSWVLSADMETLTNAAIEAIEISKRHPGQLVIPSLVAKANKQIVGVTFDDAEGAVQQMYDVNWNSFVPYGDVILIGNRAEMLSMPDNAKIYLWVKNDRNNIMIVIFDFKKYMIMDSNRKSHRRGKSITNYCSKNVIDVNRDEETTTLITMMNEDEKVPEDDVIFTILSDPDDYSFSAQI